MHEIKEIRKPQQISHKSKPESIIPTYVNKIKQQNSTGETSHGKLFDTQEYDFLGSSMWLFKNK